MQLPLPEHEVARLEVLGRYQIIFGTPPEECFDNITHLAAYVCGTPIALISFIDQNSQWFKSRVGRDSRRDPTWGFPLRQVAGDRSAETLHDGSRYSLGAGYCGAPSRALLQGVEIDGSSVESVPIWKTSGRTFCRYPLAPRMDRE